MFSSSQKGPILNFSSLKLKAVMKILVNRSAPAGDSAVTLLPAFSPHAFTIALE
jgi:hypothetical protein